MRHRRWQSHTLRRLALGLFASVLFCLLCARAQSEVIKDDPFREPKEALIAFGLVGEWSSSDCHIWRRGFEAPRWLGIATTYQINGNETTIRAKIDKAQIIYDAALRIWYDNGFGEETMTFKKEGGGIRTFEAETHGRKYIEDGHSAGSPDIKSPLFKRCM